MMSAYAMMTDKASTPAAIQRGTCQVRGVDFCLTMRLILSAVVDPPLGPGACGVGRGSISPLVIPAPLMFDAMSRRHLDDAIYEAT